MCSTCVQKLKLHAALAETVNFKSVQSVSHMFPASPRIVISSVQHLCAISHILSNMVHKSAYRQLATFFDKSV